VGGAVEIHGSATVSNCTLSGNNAVLGGALDNSGTLDFTTNTITDNDGDFGGAIYNDGVIVVSNSTISGNRATTLAGGIDNYGGTLTAMNSIIALNTTGDVVAAPGIDDTIDTSNHNVIGDTDGDPLLGALAD